MEENTAAPAPATNGNPTLLETTKANATAAYDSVTKGPVAQNVKDQHAKTASEFSNLAGSRRKPTATAATGQTLTNYHSFFFELLSWNNPRVSGIAYATIITLIFAARYLDVLRWTFKLTWMILACTVAAEVAGKVILSNGFTTQIRPRSYYMIPKESLDMIIGDVHELINFFVIEAQRIVFAENVAASATICLSSFAGYYLIKIVPFWGLCVIGTTVVFFAPLIYTSNQELIDNTMKQASDVVTAQSAQLREVAGKHTAQATNITKQYMGEYTAKAQEMIRGRSASPEATAKPAPAPAAPAAPAVPAVQESDFPAVPEDAPAQPAAPVDEEKEPLIAS